MYIVATLKSLTTNSNIWVNLEVVSIDCLLSLSICCSSLSLCMSSSFWLNTRHSCLKYVVALDSIVFSLEFLGVFPCRHVTYLDLNYRLCPSCSVQQLIFLCNSYSCFFNLVPTCLPVLLITGQQFGQILYLNLGPVLNGLCFWGFFPNFSA